MQGVIHQRGRRRLALIVAAGALTAACSTYQPLNRGSDVPWAKAGRMASAASARVSAAAPAAAKLPADRYVVQRGDRLASVAARYGVSIEALAAANQLRAPDIIYVGQILFVPEAGVAAGSGAARNLEAAVPQVVEPRVVQVAELEDERIADVAPAAGPVTVTPVPVAPDTVAPGGAAPAPVSGDRYVVRRGETLWSISRRVDVSMVELAAANRLTSPYDLLAGQRLRIPGSAPTAAPPRRVVAHGGEAPALSGQGFLWPVNGKVVGGFGRTERGQRRDGIDIAAREGAPVLAAEDGIVAYAGDGIHGYGRLILLRHGEGYITTYAHNAALLVEPGALVARGQVIARVGSTGDVTRSLLHFELRKGRKPIDPETVLVRDATAVASTE